MAMITKQDWDRFAGEEGLSFVQLLQFQRYMQLLVNWNKKHNITRVKVGDMINDHFRDSLALKTFLKVNQNDVICDVGSGGGFPAIPLKICFPAVSFVLIEIKKKKIAFLQSVIQTLGLMYVTIVQDDWRTFLRKAPVDRITYFCARASLRPEALCRALRPSSVYANAHIVYWASEHFSLLPREIPFFEKKVYYTVARKRRLLFFFKKKEA